MTIWPKQRDCDMFYGNPRGEAGAVSVKWMLDNLISIVPPFRMTYAGIPVKRITVHKRCAESLSRVLAAIWIAAGKKQSIVDKWGVSVFGGSFNFRLKRNSNTLSMHAYGVAIDLDPAKKPMGQSVKRFVPEVVKAFRDEGWVNLRNDPMHFQAARL